MELFQDGVSLGRKPSGQAAGFCALFETTWKPGKLEAVAYEDGREAGRTVLATAGQAVALKATVEPGENLEDRELIYVDLTLVDENGVCVPCCDVDLTAQVEGDGTLAGFGSGDPKPLTGYTDGISRTFHGRALAILRTSAPSGRMTLTVSAPGLPAVVREIAYP